MSATSSRVLVVGARPRSLGEAILNEATSQGYQAVAAGIAGEQLSMDLLRDTNATLRHILRTLKPRYVITTVGINEPKGDAPFSEWYTKHFRTNVIINMRLLRVFREDLKADQSRTLGYSHFVAISSNSATIPRTGSAAYCASKAALSMAVQCEAREALRAREGLLAYVYEPGLLAGTAMTEKTAAAMPDVPLTRMQGEAAHGIPVTDLARLVVANLTGGVGLAGTRIRYDAGEL